MADEFSTAKDQDNKWTWELKAPSGDVLASGRKFDDEAAARLEISRLAPRLRVATQKPPTVEEAPTGDQKVALLRLCEKWLTEPGNAKSQTSYAEEVRDVLRRVAADQASQPG